MINLADRYIRIGPFKRATNDAYPTILISEVLNGICNATKEEERRRKGKSFWLIEASKIEMTK